MIASRRRLLTRHPYGCGDPNTLPQSRIYATFNRQRNSPVTGRASATGGGCVKTPTLPLQGNPQERGGQPPSH